MSSLPPEAARWAARGVGARATVQNVRRLAGSTSSTLYALDIVCGASRLLCVLRRYDNAAWMANEPDLPRHEAAALERVTAAGLAAPALVACDADGTESGGVPCLLMTRLPGGVVLVPDNLERWLRGLAEALPPLHAVSGDGFPWSYRPYVDLTTLAVPAWSRVPALWARAIALAQGPAPPTPECLIHRDYHPNNVLWERDRVSGIVDWPVACRGAAGIDVAWCRKNLMFLYGVEAADRFLAAYKAAAGPSFTQHPHWDLLVIVEELPGPPSPYPPWAEFGAFVTAEIMRERLDNYLESVLARL